MRHQISSEQRDTSRSQEPETEVRLRAEVDNTTSHMDAEMLKSEIIPTTSHMPEL
jgi:hypothetical protein